MSKRVESEYYVTLEMFVADVKRMFANARTYNTPETIYYKCATRWEIPSSISRPHWMMLLSLMSNNHPHIIP